MRPRSRRVLLPHATARERLKFRLITRRWLAARTAPSMSRALQKRVRPLSVTCTDCDQVFSTFRGLSRHRSVQHNPDGPAIKTSTCPICLEELTESLASHLATMPVDHGHAVIPLRHDSASTDELDSPPEVSPAFKSVPVSPHETIRREALHLSKEHVQDPAKFLWPEKVLRQVVVHYTTPEAKESIIREGKFLPSKILSAFDGRVLAGGGSSFFQLFPDSDPGLFPFSYFPRNSKAGASSCMLEISMEFLQTFLFGRHVDSDTDNNSSSHNRRSSAPTHKLFHVCTTPSQFGPLKSSNYHSFIAVVPNDLADLFSKQNGFFELDPMNNRLLCFDGSDWRIATALRDDSGEVRWLQPFIGFVGGLELGGKNSIDVVASEASKVRSVLQPPHYFPPGAFQCPKCEEVMPISGLSILQMHYARCHMDEARWRCSRCTKSYKWKRNYHKHLKECHPPPVVVAT